MECPVCNKEAELFAEARPEGWIGCFCINCLVVYVTKDPEKGWKSKYCYKTAREDLSSMFSLDVEKEISALARYEFERDYCGKARNEWN